MAKTQTKELKQYKEVLEKVLYKQDYESTSNGKTYPTNRIKAELVSYSWETEVKWEVRAYEWQKVVITNSKLQLQDWVSVIKQKQVWNYIKNDETQVKIWVDEFQELIEFFKNLTVEK